jgi:hypothetical protein
MSHDPVLPQIASNYTNVAYGCQNLQNNIAGNVLSGGNAFIRIYY